MCNLSIENGNLVNILYPCCRYPVQPQLMGNTDYMAFLKYASNFGNLLNIDWNFNVIKVGLLESLCGYFFPLNNCQKTTTTKKILHTWIENNNKISLCVCISMHKIEHQKYPLQKLYNTLLKGHIACLVITEDIESFQLQFDSPIVCQQGVSTGSVSWHSYQG